MIYLQAIFTTFWTIWNHRNTVVHEGKQPNPMEVILKAQNLSCRYQETPTKNAYINRNAKETNLRHSVTGRALAPNDQNCWSQEEESKEECVCL